MSELESHLIALDLARCHPTRVERDDLFVKAGLAALVP